MVMLQRLLLGAAFVLLVLLALVWVAGQGTFGRYEGGGTPRAPARPMASLEAVRGAQAGAAAAIGAEGAKQILFGDLHVHTTFSMDAFLLTLPTSAGEGAHPPADACDFARYCSALDFWSINDHDFSLTPEHWRETVSTIRQCNAVAGGGPLPDTVAFLGWEWTQVGSTPDNHYGHKNVVLKGLADDEVPARPISSMRLAERSGPGPGLGLGVAAVGYGGRWHDLARMLAERAAVPACAENVSTRELPADCIEYAETPELLYRKLDEWGVPSIVIPHGTTWGFYTPPGSAWDKQLAGAMHDPARQTLIEVYSGHGDSEVYRDWREIEIGSDGKPSCPAPRPDYLPTCWRAGEIIRARCTQAGESADECERRAAEARTHAAGAGVAAHLTVPGTKAAEWLDAGQCRDCREASFSYRPRSSVQYILALGDFAQPQARHFRMGFMASSDNHFARPGTGYKEVNRRGFTESSAPLERRGAFAMIAAAREKPEPRSRPVGVRAPGFELFETERQSSFFMTGGLVATHASGRDREAIWDALQRREVYGTSGPRILLWFDLMNPPGAGGEEASPAPLPMGSEVAMSEAPVFRVRAVGSLEQQPGCPEDSISALGAGEIARLCKGECHNPSDVRRPITRIEVVRIRPQSSPNEPIAQLIADPWQSFACAGDPAGCTATFSDPELPASARGAVYYARAFEAPKDGINKGGLRCERDAEGNCTSVHLCAEDDPTSDCLAPHEPRAWSSPIWVDPAAAPEASPATE